MNGSRFFCNKYEGFNHIKVFRLLVRLSAARYFEGDNWRETSQNTEKGIRYDLNGNITSLRRYGLSDLENDLVYSYDGNRLSRLTDRVGSRQYSYRYDSNGNCTFDGLNNLELTYNSLNLVERAVIGTSPVLGASVVSGSAATTVLLPPDSEVPDGPETLPGLEIPGGVVTARTEYRWLSDGTKAGATSYDGTGLSSGYEYLGSLIYSSNGSRLNLQDAGFGHGRLTSSGVEYHLRDHLGSTRVVFDETSEALARNDYMPFGRKWDGGFIQSAANNRWLYNGKESQSSLGVNYLDYGSRMYCPQSGRWLTIDPLTEKYYGISPFAYCANNPVMYVDPDGRNPIAVGVAVGGGLALLYGLTMVKDKGINAQELLNAVKREVRGTDMVFTPSETNIEKDATMKSWPQAKDDQTVLKHNQMLERSITTGDAAGNGGNFNPDGNKIALTAIAGTAVGVVIQQHLETTDPNIQKEQKPEPQTPEIKPLDPPQNPEIDNPFKYVPSWQN